MYPGSCTCSRARIVAAFDRTEENDAARVRVVGERGREDALTRRQHGDRLPVAPNRRSGHGAVVQKTGELKRDGVGIDSIVSAGSGVKEVRAVRLGKNRELSRNGLIEAELS